MYALVHLGPITMINKIFYVTNCVEAFGDHDTNVRSFSFIISSRDPWEVEERVGFDSG